MRTFRLSICLVAVTITVLAGCATTTDTVKPTKSYRERGVEYAKSGVVVAGSVLTGVEIEETFGARLDLVGIQPVWLKIQNLGASSYVLFLKGIDPDYFSPFEVARRASPPSHKPVNELYPELRDHEIKRFITPGAEVSGFVYTHLDEGLKAFNVDLVGH